jgi:aspartate-semialdehyde dehydrogenase
MPEQYHFSPSLNCEQQALMGAMLGAAALGSLPAFVAPRGSTASAPLSTLETGSVLPRPVVSTAAAAPLKGSGMLLGSATLALCAAAAQRSRASRRSTLHRGTTTVMQAGGKVGCVAIVGCSGAVGEEMLKCLEKRNFPTEKVRLFAKRAAGTVVNTKFGDVTVEPFTVEAAQECEVVLMAVSGDFSLEFAKQIMGGPKNTCVIDNSSAWRMFDDVPLVIPEINGGKNAEALLIANPNCTTAVGAMALWPLHQKYKLKKVIMSTYQAASGAGAEGMAELEAGLAAYVKTGVCSKNEFFVHQLPFNVIPHIDKFQENGYTKEEMKVTWELKKIFGLADDVKISCTAVRVPTLRAHSESITIETEEKIDPAEALKILRSAPGVNVVDDTANLKYPMPLNATGCDDVEVGRVRQSLVFGDHGIEFFISGDQLLRGAALNAVIIAEQSVAARMSQA